MAVSVDFRLGALGLSGLPGVPGSGLFTLRDQQADAEPTGASHAAEPLYLFDTKGTPTLRTSRAVRCPTRPGSVGRRTR